MNTHPDHIGLRILRLINGLKINYGRYNLAKMTARETREVSFQQAKGLILQLIEKGCLKEMNVGAGFPMIVLALTDKGREAIEKEEAPSLDFQRDRIATFQQASDIGIIDRTILEEFYNVKKELIKLGKREEELKNTIKKTMIEKNVSEINSERMDIYCKTVDRVTYPKEKIERFVPQEIIEKIKTLNKSVILQTRFKNTT